MATVQNSVAVATSILLNCTCHSVASSGTPPKISTRAIGCRPPLHHGVSPHTRVVTAVRHVSQNTQNSLPEFHVLLSRCLLDCDAVSCCGKDTDVSADLPAFRAQPSKPRILFSLGVNFQHKNTDPELINSCLQLQLLVSAYNRHATNCHAENRFIFLQDCLSYKAGYHTIVAFR